MKELDDWIGFAVSVLNLATAIIALKTVKESKKNSTTKASSKKKKK
ncbi:hypothetical protein SAMN05446037_102057 [Anaerovirgula multivorans]|uniref:Uncharacterized protein n=1 Tax=Anaerovirgula multivorans TaxID=312168 RepID=A0A239H7G1_9FIRM|nr:hypothetical protein [Anaerovirgula multivorans]SNS77317.1 hypothetical protein SAMN05446037_102057 [Anaerovirgula multivorans]